VRNPTFVRSGHKTLVLAGVILTLCGAILSTPQVRAANTKKKESKEQKEPDKATRLYDEGRALAEASMHAEAMKKFEAANKERPNDPEILNMLAFTQRKVGQLDAAFENYRKALSLRERFPEAREYLGEAHVQAALEQARVLQGYGADGEKDLAELVAAFARAAVELGITDPKQQAASHDGW
jgi:tetratricopeptide (TPR) repeat protein